MTELRVGDARVSVELMQDYEEFDASRRIVRPGWTWTDPAGHRHDASLETAHWVVLYEYWCDDCRDMHDQSELQCRLCGIEVKPEYDWVHEHHAVPGLTQGRITVERGPMTATYMLMPEDMDKVPWPLTEEWVARAERPERMLEMVIQQ